MDRMKISTNSILWIIGGTLLLSLSITVFNSNYDATTNGFILYPYAVSVLSLLSGDLIAEKLVKKGTVFLIVDGETKTSIHLWVKKRLRKECLSGLITVTLALLSFHLVVRPIQGYVSSVNDIPWLGILMCVLFMTFMSYIIYTFSEAFILKRVRINKAKTYSFYLVVIYSFFSDLNILNLDQLIFIYILIGLIVMFATKSKRNKEIERYYVEDLA